MHFQIAGVGTISVLCLVLLASSERLAVNRLISLTCSDMRTVRLRQDHRIKSNRGRKRCDSIRLAQLLIAAACLCVPPAFAEDHAGQASIIDGDTLEIHGTRIRLWGIDAPESSQLCRNDDSLQYRCGAKAANELDAFIARRPVDCSPVSLDQYRRTVAVCSIDGVDLGEWLVRNGLALDWPRYSKGKYDTAQRDAEHAGRGMWAGSYVEPWLFRACIRQGGRPGDCSDDAQSHP
jgi:endonuclease YncB( thermonuclease family)